MNAHASLDKIHSRLLKWRLYTLPWEYTNSRSIRLHIILLILVNGRGVYGTRYETNPPMGGGFFWFFDEIIPRVIC